MSKGPFLRPAHMDDLDAILAIERACSTAPHWPPAEYSRMVVVAEAGEPKRVLLVAGIDGVVRGFAAGKLLGSVAELESVAVQAALRRNGLGGKLCRAVLRWARERGATEAELEVRAGSLGAQRIYAALGFVVVARRPGYYEHPAEDALLMHCDFASSTSAAERRSEPGCGTER